MQYQRHRVIAALVLAPVDGKIHYVYSGGLIPLGVVQDRLDDWLRGGLIAEVASAPPPPATAEIVQRQLAAAGVTVTIEEAQAILDQQSPQGESSGGEDDDTGSGGQLPAGAPAESANKPVWVEYAVSRGMDRAEAEKATKADLIAALTAQA